MFFVWRRLAAAVFICSYLNFSFFVPFLFFAKPRLSDVRCVYSNITVAIRLRRLSVSFLFLVSAARKKKRNQKKKDRWCKSPPYTVLRLPKSTATFFQIFVKRNLKIVSFVLMRLVEKLSLSYPLTRPLRLVPRHLPQKGRLNGSPFGRAPRKR